MGAYVITDPEEQSLGLPKGDYDVYLALGAKIYNKDGSLRYDTNNSFGLCGDVIHVYVDVLNLRLRLTVVSNGQPWPYLKVEPRKYRVRLLNAAVSRSKTTKIRSIYVRTWLSS